MWSESGRVGWPLPDVQDQGCWTVAMAIAERAEWQQPRFAQRKGASCFDRRCGCDGCERPRSVEECSPWMPPVNNAYELSDWQLTRHIRSHLQYTHTHTHTHTSASPVASTSLTRHSAPAVHITHLGGLSSRYGRRRHFFTPTSRSLVGSAPHLRIFLPTSNKRVELSFSPAHSSLPWSANARHAP